MKGYINKFSLFVRSVKGFCRIFVALTHLTTSNEGILATDATFCVAI